jgi:hypothetical protein
MIYLGGTVCIILSLNLVKQSLMKTCLNETYCEFWTDTYLSGAFPIGLKKGEVCRLCFLSLLYNMS